MSESAAVVTVNDPTKYIPTDLNAGVDAFKATGNFEYDSMDFTNLTPVPATFIT